MLFGVLEVKVKHVNFKSMTKPSFGVRLPPESSRQKRTIKAASGDSLRGLVPFPGAKKGEFNASWDTFVWRNERIN